MASSNSSTNAPRRSKESEKIGSFQRQEEIGRGSFATVYKAIHTSPQGTSSVVAIKSVNLGKLNKKLKDNLTSEISILKGLHHPHIVALIDCKDTSSHIHLVMEYVALGDLSYFIKKRDLIKDSELVGNMMEKYPNPRNGGLHEVVVRHFLQQLSSALQFLRARNLIHRDVKPQNLLLNPSPEYFERHTPSVMPYCASEDALNPICGIKSLPMLKIADFGFARSLPSTSLAETLCGSPLYMAPEILRYEKYDAKADLWSVGTVLYEMITSKPPFRAANHVELLRRIEKGEDRIKFGDDIVVSDALKKLIRSLLKRDPKERLNFPEFFSNEIITGPIPGLAPEDMPTQPQSIPRRGSDRRQTSRTDPTDTIARPGKIQEPESPYIDQQQGMLGEGVESRQASAPVNRRMSNITRQAPMSQPAVEQPLSRRQSNAEAANNPSSRPGLTSHVTAPGRQELHDNSPMVPQAIPMASRQLSSGRSQNSQTHLKQQTMDAQRGTTVRKQEDAEQERVAQDIAFERDYVLVEKRAVEVNALADELEASPRLSKQRPSQATAMTRRATSQGIPASTTGAQTSASRAVQIAQGKKPDSLHNRQNSYERRYGPSPSSATSAISKALNMASGRLFGVGFSPPVNLRPGGRSPPVGYSPFPQYPGAQSSLVVVGDNKQPSSVDEDTRFVQNIEEIATRSDVVYGFAEVKYKQLTPAVPSVGNNGLGLRHTDSSDSATDDLTIEAVVTVAEEALVLYVKALALLAKAMDIAARWWARKNREGSDTSSVRGNGSVVTSGQRTNNVVQWIRSRFNEVLEKADLVRMKLLESQKKLPEDHPSHPNNISAGTASSAGMGTSVDHVVVSTGITAEKLMYDRALEMSRSAAISELTGEDLQGCEISYVTAIRMLEAVLETDEEPQSRKGSGTSDQDKQDSNDDDLPITGLEDEDRKAVKALVQSIRGRLASLRKKLQVIHKRASAPAMGSPNRASPPIPNRTSTPTIASVSTR